jgi:hypothetical protein
MVVELDVFSGLPNPRWQLSEGEAADFARLVEGLERASDDSSPTPPGLGYRGFRLSGPAGSPSSWAYRGFVRSPGGLLADPSRRVERFLLGRLPADYSALRRSLEVEFGGVTREDH